jgi:hypothetical protein
VLLGDLADKADKLWAQHFHQHGIVAAVEAKEDDVPATAVRQAVHSVQPPACQGAENKAVGVASAAVPVRAARLTWSW